MPRDVSWFWTAEKLEELIAIMKEESDVSDPATGTFMFRGSTGLARRLVTPYDKVDETVTIGTIGMALQYLCLLGMLEPGRPGALKSDYERKFTPRPVTADMIRYLREWKAMN